jgi:hypothetical protein
MLMALSPFSQLTFKEAPLCADLERRAFLFVNHPIESSSGDMQEFCNLR